MAATSREGVGENSSVRVVSEKAIGSSGEQETSEEREEAIKVCCAVTRKRLIQCQVFFKICAYETTFLPTNDKM